MSALTPYALTPELHGAQAAHDARQAEARARIEGAGGDALVVILAELMRLHERVDAIEALAVQFSELTKGGMGGLLGLFTKG